jgi:sterol desaturase/sphingolipid hydroxylase (fatty acid hydroxylase superfamily)
MLDTARELFHDLDALLRTVPVARALVISIAVAVIVYSALGAIFLFVERRAGRDTTRYRSAHFVNDVAYTLLYQGGIYNVLIYAPFFALAAPRLKFLQLDIVKGLPAWAAIVVFWLTVDFLAYWLHRMQHVVPALWAFHSVHHTQTRMTFLTSNRNHLLEQFYVNVIMLGPALILGLPPAQWMPIYFAQMFFEHAQHAQLPWSYGPFHRLLVSPAFHAMHHGTEPEEYNGNYAKILSLWDVVFGTFVPSKVLPARYGVNGMDVPENLAAQFVHPFRVLTSDLSAIDKQPESSLR